MGMGQNLADGVQSGEGKLPKLSANPTQLNIEVLREAAPPDRGTRREACSKFRKGVGEFINEDAAKSGHMSETGGDSGLHRLP